MKVDNGVWIYDIETLSNCFTYSAINRDTQEKIFFIIWEDVNQIKDLYEHLSNVKGLIGFNNINFDYPVLHYMMKNSNHLASLSSDEITGLVYKKAQETIKLEYSAINEKEVIIPQLDLFRIWHYDNKARMTSLKKLQISMGYKNVQDMPYHHTETIVSFSQVIEIIEYNFNDVESTLQFYEKTIPKLKLRRGLRQKYSLNCLNYPDSKIGEELTLKLYCEATGKNPADVRKLRTRRKTLKFSEAIPSYIKYETDEFNGLLNYLKDIEVPQLKDSFKYSLLYHNFQFDYGTGGIHGCIKPGIYEADNEYIIIDSDVASLYPSLAITQDLYPNHLGEEFAKVYENGIVKPRLKAKKEGDMVMSDGFKLSANAVYGKSNSEFSFLYDPLYTLKTTLSGQLALSMLSEMLIMRIPNLTMLQINTDGLTTKLPRTHTETYFEICEEWQKITRLMLEHVEYEKMIIRDVNNYIAVSIGEMSYVNNKVEIKEKSGIKYKGIFKTNADMVKDGEFHKSMSQGIVSVAVNDYFLNGKPVEETIFESRDIFLFTKVFNASHGWKCETVDGDSIVEQQKTNRYYISNNGKTFRKLKNDRVIEIEAGGTLVTIFNKFEEKPFNEYDINYQYYIEECYKVIHKIDGTEERLENERIIKREEERRIREEDNFLKFCVNKIPTERQWGLYNRQWLIDKYVALGQHDKFKNFI